MLLFKMNQIYKRLEFNMREKNRVRETVRRSNN